MPVSLRLLAFLFVLVPLGMAQDFPNPLRISTPYLPQQLIAADVNADGHADVVAIYRYLDTAARRWQLSAQSFFLSSGKLVSVSAVTPIQSISNAFVADVTGDGLPDLICQIDGAAPAKAMVLVYPGRGDGTFAQAIASAESSSDLSGDIRAVVDVTRDGLVDLVLQNQYSVVTVMPGDGKGHFSQGPTSATGVQTTSMRVADLNGDGTPDLLTDGQTPQVLLGRGDGTFARTGIPLPTNSYPVDVDGDGKLDVVGNIQEAAPNPNLGLVFDLEVVHGNGDGSFQTAAPLFYSPIQTGPPNYRNGYAAWQVIGVHDLNGDGLQDLLVQGEQDVTVLLGRSGFRFDQSGSYPVGTHSLFPDYPTLVADVDGDGHVDLLGIGTEGIVVALGKPDGSFATAPVLFSGDAISTGTAADFDEDGIADVITQGTVLFFNKGTGTGTFAPAVALAGTEAAGSNMREYTARRLVHGDFNGDGHQDLIAANPISNDPNASLQYWLLLGRGDGTFQPPRSTYTFYFPESGQFNTSLAEALVQDRVRDIDGDGADDVIYSEVRGPAYFLAVLRGQKDGTFSNPDRTKVNGYAWAADVDGDGKIDAITVEDPYTLGIRPGDKSALFPKVSTTLTLPASLGKDIAIRSVIAANVVGSGRSDVVALVYAPDNSASELIVFPNLGNLQFGPAVLSPVPSTYARIRAADFDRDGRDDVVLYNEKGEGLQSGLHLEYGQPSAIFKDGGYLATPSSGIGLMQIVDVNADGRPDIVAGGSNLGNTFAVLVNQVASGGSGNPVINGTLTVNPEPAIFGDAAVARLQLLSPNGMQQLTGTVTFTVDGAGAQTAALAGNVAQVGLPGQLSVGTHNVSARWSGSAGAAAPLEVALTVQHRIAPLPTQVTLTLAPAALTVGDTLTAAASVRNQSADPALPLPGGSLVLHEGSLSYGSQTAASFAPVDLVTGTATVTSAGTHTVAAEYSGDALHAGSSSTATTSVQPVATRLQLVPSANPSVAGQPIVLTIQLTSTTAHTVPGLLQGRAVTLTGLPGGDVSVVLNTASPSGGFTVATGTYTTAALPGGTYTLVARFVGTADALASASPVLTQTVQPAASVVSLVSNLNPAYQSDAITFRVIVSGVGTPGGQITLLDGSQPLATLPLVQGSAIFTTRSLAVGTHALSAQYSGDGSNVPAISPTLSQQVLASDFSLSQIPPVSMRAGEHTTITLQATAIGNFNDTLTLTSSGSLPPVLTLRFTPSAMPLRAGGTTSASVYVDTDAVLGFYARFAPLRSSGKEVLAAVVAMCGVTGLRRRKPAAALRACGLLGVLVAVGLLSGCGDRYPATTPPGDYDLTFVATGQATGQTHRVVLHLHLDPEAKH